MLNSAIKVKENIIKATATYLKYHEDNHNDWDDSEKKIAEETIGLLVLSGQRLKDIESHYEKDPNIETLPEGFPDKESMESFVKYFEIVSIELLKQIPVQYHATDFTS